MEDKKVGKEDSKESALERTEGLAMSVYRSSVAQLIVVSALYATGSKPVTLGPNHHDGEEEMKR